MRKNDRGCRPNGRVRRINGIPLVPGRAYGTAYRIEPQYPLFYRIKISRTAVDDEITRFHRAIDRSREQYARDREKLERTVGREHSYIIEAHLQMLEDRYLNSETEKLVREHLVSPEKALIEVSDRLLTAYQSLEDPFFRERAFDFEEVIERIISNLTELSPAQDEDPPEDMILVAPEIGLSLLARYPLERIRGLVTTKGGRTSHVAIIARSYQIPFVCGIEHLRDTIQTGDFVIIDGSVGTVDVSEEGPGEEALFQLQETRVPVGSVDREPCMTRDGEKIHLLANTEDGGEVESAIAQGAEGIGLFRSEYLYIRRRIDLGEWSGPADVYAALTRMVGDRPVIVRTLDISERRDRDAGEQAGEEAGSLGIRGIRYSLKYPDSFRKQIQEILAALPGGDLSIVLPMISSLDEVIQAREIIRQAQRETAAAEDISPIKVGILVEVPAAVLTLDSLARHADFLAVGTNDLIQYTLAASRLNDDVAYLHNPYHPAILASLHRVVQVARAQGLPAMVCGEMAGNPVSAALLVGLGFRRLSMTARSIPEVKQFLRRCSARELEDSAAELLQLENAAEIEKFVNSRFGMGPLMESAGV